MNKNIILIAMLSTAVSAPALAAEGVFKDAYISGKVGVNLTDLSSNKFNVSPFGFSDSFSSDDNKALFSGEVAYGWNLEPSLHVPVRTELAYSIQKNQRFDGTYALGLADFYAKDAVRVKQQSVMWNTYYDWKNTTKFTPYFAVGIGATQIKTKGDLSINSDQFNNHQTLDNSSRSNTNFVWSVGVGTSYTITPNLAADFSYKYIDSGKLTQYYEFGPDVETHYKLRAHNLALGLRYSF